jgi:hypothetical protein
MPSNGQERCLNIVAKNHAGALCGLPPCSISPPTLHLCEDFSTWFSEEYEQCSARAQATKNKLLPRYTPNILSANIPLHLRDWDQAQLDITQSTSGYDHLWLQLLPVSKFSVERAILPVLQPASLQYQVGSTLVFILSEIYLNLS